MTDPVLGARSSGLTEIAAALGRDGFAHVRPAPMRDIVERAGLSDWDGFAASWERLGIDTYMADGGRYRRRRHAALAAYGDPTAGGHRLERKPAQPHYQSRDHNRLNGGVARWFDPIEEGMVAHPALTAILGTCHVLFDGLTPAQTRPPRWHVELHQFRIEARPGQDGQPTPEGLHRDGVDWVLVLLVRRENIASGETSIHDLQRRRIGAFTLAEPFEAAFVDDNRVYHGVTAVRPLDPSRPAYRDVLVVTFRRE